MHEHDGYNNGIILEFAAGDLLFKIYDDHDDNDHNNITSAVESDLHDWKSWSIPKCATIFFHLVLGVANGCFRWRFPTKMYVFFLPHVTSVHSSSLYFNHQTSYSLGSSSCFVLTNVQVSNLGIVTGCPGELLGFSQSIEDIAETLLPTASSLSHFFQILIH